jgi:hypothetical protein
LGPADAVAGTAEPAEHTVAVLVAFDRGILTAAPNAAGPKLTLAVEVASVLGSSRARARRVDLDFAALAAAESVAPTRDDRLAILERDERAASPLPKSKRPAPVTSMSRAPKSRIDPLTTSTRSVITHGFASAGQTSSAESATRP